MQYKTIIEIVTDAENRKEAIKLADSHLSGSLRFGKVMKYYVMPAQQKKNFPLIITVLSITFLVCALSVLFLKSSHNASFGISANNAVNPPLKTSGLDNKKSADFKDEWQKKQDKEILNYLKK